MAGMMPSASTANHPYDNDALERDDLIDPDDGELPSSTCSSPPKLASCIAHPGEFQEGLSGGIVL